MVEFLVGWLIGLLTIPLGKIVLPWFFAKLEKKLKEKTSNGPS